MPYSRRWALLTVGFEFLTLTFVAEARSISIDQMVSAISLTAIYSAHRAYREKTPAPNILILFLLVAGFLLRGPMGLVIPAGVVLAHQWLTAGWRATAGAGCGASARTDPRDRLRTGCTRMLRWMPDMV